MVSFIARPPGPGASGTGDIEGGTGREATRAGLGAIRMPSRGRAWRDGGGYPVHSLRALTHCVQEGRFSSHFILLCLYQAKSQPSFVLYVP